MKEKRHCNQSNQEIIDSSPNSCTSKQTELVVKITEIQVYYNVCRLFKKKNSENMIYLLPDHFFSGSLSLVQKSIFCQASLNHYKSHQEEPWKESYILWVAHMEGNLANLKYQQKHKTIIISNNMYWKVLQLWKSM